MLGLFTAIFGLYGGGALSCEVYGRYIVDDREEEPWSNYFWSQPWVVVYTTIITTLLLIILLSLCSKVKGNTERYLCVFIGLATVLTAETFLIYKKKQLLQARLI